MRCFVEFLAIIYITVVSERRGTNTILIQPFIAVLCCLLPNQLASACEYTSNYLNLCFVYCARRFAHAPMILFRKLCIRAPPRHPHCPLSPSIPRRHCIFAHAAPSTYHGTYFGSFTDLEPWQRQRIEEAFDVGRRKVAVCLPSWCADLSLSVSMCLNICSSMISLEPATRLTAIALLAL